MGTKEGTTTYTTEGPIRGACPHRHRSLVAALKCLQRDQDGCASQGGYSDRELYGDGRWLPTGEYMGRLVVLTDADDWGE